MEHHVGIDVSLELSSLCVLDATGKVIRETKVASEPEALVAFLRGLGVTIVRVGLDEPRRVCRRLFCLSHAAVAHSSAWA
jgi:hypothetical protein